MKKYTLIVKGKVQGVGLRFHTYQIAKKLNISGYVKNLPDGSVKIIVECNDNILKKFKYYLIKGNGYYRIEEINELSCKKIDNLKKFIIK